MNIFLLLQEWLHTFLNLLIDPFLTYPFLKKAFLGCAALSLGCGSVGAFLTLRRMNLIADALSHGLFPGVALAFLLAGFQIGPLSIGGAITAVGLGLVAHHMATHKTLTADSTFTVLVFFSTALGFFILAFFGNYTDVMHILLGNVLALSRQSLLWLGSIATTTLFFLALFYRPLVLKAFDPAFFKLTYKNYGWLDTLFLLFVALNTVCAFQALGSLVALGLILIPAITARLLTRHIWTLCLTATFLALLASGLGILLSYYGGYPTGPLIILICTAFYFLAFMKKGWGRKMTFILFCTTVFGTLYYEKQPATKPQIVVSFTVLKDLVRQLTKEDFRVTSLVGPDQDPHLFEPSPQDLLQLAQADLIVINGLHLENHWLPRFLDEHAETSVVEAASKAHVHFLTIGTQKIPDPHAWHDVREVKKYIQVIEHALCKKWPKKKSVFKKRARNYQKKLDALHADMKKQLGSIPKNRRTAITTHDGLGYFGRAYHIKFLTPLGFSTSAEPKAKDLAVIIETVKKEKIRGLFFENMVSKKLIHTIAQETGLKIGGTLYSDSLSDDDGPAKSYLDMMRHNAAIVQEALG